VEGGVIKKRRPPSKGSSAGSFEKGVFYRYQRALWLAVTESLFVRVRCGSLVQKLPQDAAVPLRELRVQDAISKWETDRETVERLIGPFFSPDVTSRRRKGEPREERDAYPRRGRVSRAPRARLGYED